VRAKIGLRSFRQKIGNRQRSARDKQTKHIFEERFFVDNEEKRVLAQHMRKLF